MAKGESNFKLMLLKLLSKELEDPTEQWIDSNFNMKVDELIGYQKSVAMTNKPKHSSNENMNGQIYLFYMQLLNS